MYGKNNDTEDEKNVDLYGLWEPPPDEKAVCGIGCIDHRDFEILSQV